MVEVELSGGGGARLSLRIDGTARDGRFDVDTRAAFDGLSARVSTEVGVDELAAFWLELDALVRGETDRAAFEPSTGTLRVVLRARDAGAALQLVVRAAAGCELRGVFAVGRVSLTEARDVLARAVADLSGPSAELWE